MTPKKKSKTSRQDGAPSEVVAEPEPGTYTKAWKEAVRRRDEAHTARLPATKATCLNLAELSLSAFRGYPSFNTGESAPDTTPEP